MDLLSDIKHYSLTSDPASVSRITPILYSQFAFAKGKIRIEGCAIEDRPIFECGSGELKQFRFSSGKELDDSWQSLLATNGTTELKKSPLTHHDLDLELNKFMQNSGVDAASVRRIVWCKFVTGKMEIEADSGEAISHRFYGWSHRIVNGPDRVSPYCCPRTGAHGYEFDVTDSGTINVADAIRICELSGKKLLIDEMEKCVVTGKLVAKSLLIQSPVSGDWFLSEKARTCTTCQIDVLPGEVLGRQCCGCKALSQEEKIQKEKLPAKLLDIYPSAANFNQWNFSSNFAVDYWFARSFWKVLLVVRDREKDRFTIRQRNRWFGRWENNRSGVSKPFASGVVQL